MKKVLISFVMILFLVMSGFMVYNAVNFAIKKGSGEYIAVDATVTYVNETVTSNDKTFTKKEHSTGEFTWEYDGVTHNVQDERSSKIEIEYGTKEGDTISIWINSDNGRFVDINSKKESITRVVMAIIMPLFWLATFFGIKKLSKKNIEE